MYISKKTMRQKDFAALKAKKPGFKKFKVGKSMLYRTKRGWFLSSPNEETKSTMLERFLSHMHNCC